MNTIVKFKKIYNNIDRQYLDNIKLKKTSFTRCRKQSADTVFLQMFAYKGKSMKNEVHDFYCNYNKNDDVTAWGYGKRRLEFNPEALRIMNHDFIKDIYSDEKSSLTKLNGYYIFAIDGSDINLPSTDENRKIYGSAKGGYVGARQPAMASISCIYDCINKYSIDIVLNRYKYAESKLAVSNIDAMQNIISKDKKRIILFDRGYCGVKLLLKLLDDNEKFVFRLSTTQFKKEQKSMTSEDELIQIVFDNTRMNAYKQDADLIEKMKKFNTKLRFTRIQLETLDGETVYEYLLSNIDGNEFDTNTMGELYNLRWQVETSYRTMKSQLKMEQFSGRKSIIIAQDVYITAFVYNVINGILIDNGLNKIIKEEKYKYKMKVNRNYSIGIIKSYLVKILILASSKERDELTKEMNYQIKKNVIPIRDGRSYSRNLKSMNKGGWSYKYSY